jgi:hypothetical protein
LRLPEVILGSALLALSLAAPGSAFEPEEANNPLVNQFLTASKKQQEALRGTQMEVDIDAQLPKLKESGKMKVLKTITKLGKIGFARLGDFVGDRTVQHEVIERYLALENENSENPENPSIAITPANYKFRVKTKMTQGDSRTYVFELTPKRKTLGLFKGELWVDAATGMPLRESGTLVKTSSIFVKRISFVNEYKLQNGVSLPSHTECHADTIVGRADLNIRFSNLAPAAEQERAQIAGTP